MRAWGRINGVWEAVTTDASGSNDYVYVTNLAQVLLLNQGESPFFANYGIPAQRSVVTQVFPDYYIALTQTQFSPYFASLIVSKVTSPTPAYNINLVTQQGVAVAASIPI